MGIGFWVMGGMVDRQESNREGQMRVGRGCWQLVKYEALGGVGALAPIMWLS